MWRGSKLGADPSHSISGSGLPAIMMTHGTRLARHASGGDGDREGWSKERGRYGSMFIWFALWRRDVLGSGGLRYRCQGSDKVWNGEAEKCS